MASARRWLLLLLLLAAGGAAAVERAREIVVYVRGGCPHCADAEAFLAELSTQRPELRIVVRHVDTDAAARDELAALAREVGLWPPGVPTFVIGAQVLIGFDDAAHTGRDIVALLGGAPPPAAEVESRVFGTLSASRLGLPLFTLALGLLDGFNPCAMWVLLFLLSLLVRLRDRRRMALIAGTFVLVSGAVYYAFMAAWLNLFEAVGLSDALRVGLALLALAIGVLNLKDFAAPGQGPSLSIPAAARPRLVARMHALPQARNLAALLAGVGLLALAVNTVELLCTAGLPALYTAVLSQQELSRAMHHAYLGLYILGYIADDSLMVATAVLALGSRKLDERSGRRLKLLSGAVMLALGLVLLVRPQWLLVSSGRTVAASIDDAAAAALYGTPVAAQTAAPHSFVSADWRAAVIWVDRRQVYPLAGSASRFEFPLAPRWSPDGRSRSCRTTSRFSSGPTTAGC